MDIFQYNFPHLYGTVHIWKNRNTSYKCLFDVIAEDEATTLKRALPNFDSVDQDDLLDVLQLHDSKTLSVTENIEKC